MSDKVQMVIANRLHDGLTVFLASGNDWVEAIDLGCIARGEAEAAALLGKAQRAAEQNAVVNPYLIEIIDLDGRRTPREWREAIRASGPTVETRSTA